MRNMDKRPCIYLLVFKINKISRSERINFDDIFKPGNKFGKAIRFGKKILFENTRLISQANQYQLIILLRLKLLLELLEESKVFVIPGEQFFNIEFKFQGTEWNKAKDGKH